MDVKKTIISAAFLLFGIFMIHYSLSQPCEVGDITQTIGNMTSTVQQPVKMNRMVCLSTDFPILVTLLLGTASIFPGMSGLHKAVIGDK
jgi:hypothetical protein